MRRVGVAVEGPSDRVFWTRVLGRQFAGAGCWFDIRSLNGRDRLIREAPGLAETFRNAKYEAAYFVLDADDAPCPPEVLNLLDEEIKREVTRQPASLGYAHMCVAFRELESWILADEICIRELLNFPEYCFEHRQGPPPAKAKLVRFCRERGFSPAGMEDRDFAKQAAGRFDPERAQTCSPSLAYFWTRLCDRLKPRST